MRSTPARRVATGDWPEARGLLPIVTGFSQGGMLTMTLAVHHPEVVGSAVAIGGWLPPPLWPRPGEVRSGAPRLLALHGTADNAVAYLPTLEAVASLKAAGYDAELRGYEGVRHVISPEIQRDLVDALVSAIHRAQPPQEASP